MTLDEVAAMTQLPPATLRYYRSTGVGGPASFKLGRRVMYRRQDVLAWIDERYVASVSAHGNRAS